VVVAAGSHALRTACYGVDTSFSTMVAITRNPQLDGMMEGCSLGRAPLPPGVLAKRVKFGDITELTATGRDRGYTSKSGGPGPNIDVGVVRRAGFGSEMTVRPIVVGGRYH